MPPTTTSAGIDLLNEITCPNCWKKFPPEAALAIAGHGDLLGDPRLEDVAEPRRFVPTRFTPECAALDEKDTPSYELACPHCHLLVPRVIFERRETIFLSIFGDVSSGKSYFLSAMARQMETILPQRFGIGVTEPHPASNTVIRNYKNQLFNTPDPDALVFIPSTSPSGRIHYQGVKDPGEVRQYPRPMFFQAAPTGRHPNATKPLRYTRTICLYDNSGEHFRADYAKPNKPETEHLARSSAMIFVFDPTREPAFMERCAAGSQDPQFEIAAKTNTEPQEVILATADQNVKKWMGRMIAEPLDKPLVMILAKFDAWKHFVAGDLPPYATGPHGDSTTLHAFNADEVDRISGKMRELLLKMCPSIVATAERFSRRVCYIPTSATGCSPIIAGRDAENGKRILKFRRGSIRPIWAEVPLLWILDQLTTGVVPVAHAKDPAS
jgi:hypothetical protein